MKLTLGIDLGTTTTVASAYRKGSVETILIEGDNRLCPSVVSFKDKNTMVVGNSAKKRLIIDPEHTIGSVKRSMGNRKKVFSIFNKDYTPVEISSFILKKVVSEAEKKFGEKIEDVIITVPAYFNEDQKEDTRNAGKEAGLNVLRLVPEPTAAAIAYGLDKGKDQTIMVYDLGGGTFDVSILKIKGNDFNVMAVDGDSYLGGDDFDNAIVEYLMEVFEEKTGKNLAGDNSKNGLVAKQKLKEAAELAKKELSVAMSADINVPEIMGENIQETLTLEKYNELIKPLIDKTIAKIRSILKEAEMTSRDIDRVILVGGSTRNKIVKEVVTKEIKEPFIAEKVDEMVSHGAAIYAAFLSVPEEGDTPVEIGTISERTGHSLGVQLLDEYNKPFFKSIIGKNSEYPIKQGIIAFTAVPFQQVVQLEVFRGENKDCGANTRLGQLRLKILNLSKDQIPISAIFELDEDGILEFTAVELSKGKAGWDVDEVVNEALNSDGMINIGKVKKLMDKKLVPFEKTKITVSS